MASLIGGRELCDAMGLDWYNLTVRQKVAMFLNRNRVPFISISSNRPGNVRGLLIDAEALHSVIWKRSEAKAIRRGDPDRMSVHTYDVQPDSSPDSKGTR